MRLKTDYSQRVHYYTTAPPITHITKGIYTVYIHVAESCENNVFIMPPQQLFTIFALIMTESLTQAGV